MKIAVNFGAQNCVMLIKSTLYVIFLFLATGVSAQSVVINEVMTANTDAVMEEEFYNFSEWVELFNPSSGEINLTGWYLSDDPFNLQYWQFPGNTKIGPGDYLVVWLDKMNLRLHASFFARSDDELIILSDPAGNVADSIHVRPPVRNYSLGRLPDGSASWDTLSPTPGLANKGEVPGRAYPSPVPDHTAGRYEGPIQIALTNPAGTGTIHYTLDGSDPTSESPVYTQPVRIEVTATLKARIIGSLLPGTVRVSTYFINERPFTLPVVSLSTKPDYFFDPSIGIYVTGENGIMGCTQVANYNRDWERPVNFEYFTTDGLRKFNRDAGVQVSGNCSRDWSQKSLSIAFRDKYGKNKLIYPFFNDKAVDRFKSLLLRNSGNDFNETHFRDGLMQSLVIGQMDVDALGYSPASVYVNGSYWGVLNIREKPNEDYLYSNYGLDKDSVDFLENNNQIIAGDNQDYLNLVSYLNSNDLSAHLVYETVKSQIDIESYINYQFTELFYGNIDWPGNNNRYWKSKKPGSKWRWLLYDLDLGFGLYTPVTQNTLVYATASNSSEYNNAPWSTLLFRKLLENDEFRNRFVDKAIVYMGTVFRPERTVFFIDSIQTLIREEMYYHNLRWDFSPNYWDGRVEGLRDFGRQRPDIMTRHLTDFFDLRNPVPLEVRTNYKEKGLFSLNDVEVNDTVFKGNCFAYRPLKMKANDHKALVFDHWDIIRNAGTDSIYTETDTAKTLEMIAWTPTQVTGVYRYREIEGGILINEFCTSNSMIMDEFGEFNDWIEIVNMEDHPVNLAGFCFTDDEKLPDKWMIPLYSATETTIPSKGYKVFWADGHPEQGALHVDFKLSSLGGYIGISQIYQGQTVILDQISYTQQTTNSSYGRYKDGTERWFTFSVITPGVSNELDIATGQPTRSEPGEMLVYPNPVQDKAIISLPPSGDKEWSLSLCDSYGRVIRSWKNQSGEKADTDFSGLSGGVYLLRANCGRENFILRIVKLK